MYPVSADFASTLLSSHRIATKVEVSSAAVGTITLDVIAGNVSVAKEVSGRRRCSITLVDSTGTLTPESATSLLAPFGNELRLYRGLYVNGATEYVPLGVFGISECVVEDGGGNLTIDVQGFDRARRVQRAKFASAYTVAAGTNYTTAIKTIIETRVSASTTYNFTNTARITPALTFDAGEDPWEVVTAMATSIGYILYFDPDGVCTLVPEPNPLTAPVSFTYAEGETATLLSVNKKQDDEKTYNHIVVAGETSSNSSPVRAEALDLVVSSPTYVYGPYGDVVLFHSSQYVTSQEQAQEAADAALRRSIGYSEQVRINAIPNPALEVDDIIEIVRDNSRVAGRYVIDSFNIPLEASGVMNLNTRARTLS